MNYVCCGSDALTERPEVTAQGHRRLRRRDGGRQINERSGGVLNRTCLPSDVIAAALKDVRGSLLEVGAACCATPTQIFTKIVMPATVPFIMTGIRLAVGLGIIGIIVAEFFTSITGLGGMIVKVSNVFATAKLFVPIIVIGLLGVALAELVGLLERRLSRWRINERSL